MLKLHLCVPNCCEGLLQHGKGKKNNYFDIFSAFLVNTDQMLSFADGFSILLIYVSFLCWSLTCQQKTLDFVILLMRLVE